MFVKVVKVLSMLQKGEDVSVELEDIIDDDVKSLLSKIQPHQIPIPDTPETPEPAEFLKGVENSKIGALASEISKDIDVSGLNIEKPEDIGKLLDFSGSNNFLGDIVGKVSSKLTEKISSGEIKQEELISEAMSMMSMLNTGGGIGDILKNMGGLGGLANNPMMAEMMKHMKKGKVQTRNQGSSSSTRDRLRKKLDERKKNQDA